MNDKKRIQDILDAIDRIESFEILKEENNRVDRSIQQLDHS